MKASIVLTAVFFSLQLPAQQTVRGTLTADTRWFGEIRVTGDVIVPQGVTLTIEPGTDIFFSPKADASRSGKDPKHVEIIVMGRILAEGSREGGAILFTSGSHEPQMYDWYGIIIKDNTERSRFKNCIIEYAYKGITCYGSDPEIISCEIRYNQYAGISAEVRSNPLIRSSTITGNDFAGLNCELASNPVVEKNVISQNLNGVVIFDRSRPDLGRVSPGPGESVGENLIINNFERNIYNHSANDIFAQNNLWNTSADAQIQATLFDNARNPSKGKVVFNPLFGGVAAAQRRPEALPAAPEEPAAEQPAREAANNSAVASQTSPASQNAPASPGPATTQAGNTTPAANPPAQQTVSPSAAAPANNPGAAQPAQSTPGSDNTQYLAANSATSGSAMIQNPPPAVVQPETLYIYKEIPVEKPAAPEPEIAEPVIEALLDGGQRQYVQRVPAEYPGIYLKTAHQGRVLVEVIVGRDGRVEESRVLRSDGNLFTESALAALKKFRYKPGTYQGKPVRFKIVEPFIFKLSQ